MRPHPLRTLLRKEALRLSAQRGTMGMALLMVVAAVLLSTVGSRSLGQLGLGGDVGLCVVDYWKDDPWLEHLRSHPPADATRKVELRSLARHDGWIRYPTGAVGIQLRVLDAPAPAHRYKVWVWHPGGTGTATSWCEDWFWQQSRQYFFSRARPELREESTQSLETALESATAEETAWQQAESFARFREQVVAGLQPGSAPANIDATIPRLQVQRSALRSGTRASPLAAVAMALVLLASFFVGVFLLPSITCEEREKGTMLAVALSPASARDILGAKLAFYFAAALGLGALMAGICVPSALTRPFFWLSLAAIAFGAVAVGMTIAAIARTQRAASTGALLYLFATGILLVTTKGSALEPVTWIMLERHGPELLLAALSGNVERLHWASLGLTFGIGLGWSLAASVAYRRSGWR